MSNDATNIISLDAYRVSGTYAEALLLQAHQKEAAFRSAKFLNYGWSTNENVLCSKTTQHRKCNSACVAFPLPLLSRAKEVIEATFFAATHESAYGP